MVLRAGNLWVLNQPTARAPLIGVSYLKDHNIQSIKAKEKRDSYYALQLEKPLEPVLRRV